MKKKKSDEMLHRHHIIPKHMGGSDDLENIEMITPYEHYLRHKELYDRFKNRDSEVKLVDGTTKNTKWLAERNKQSMNASLHVHENYDRLKNVFSMYGKKGALKSNESRYGIPQEFGDYPITPLSIAIRRADKYHEHLKNDKSLDLDGKNTKFRVEEIKTGITYIITKGITKWINTNKISNVYSHFKKNPNKPIRRKGFIITLIHGRKK